MTPDKSTRLKSLCALVGWRFREFAREPSANVWVVFMPLLWMVVLGFAFQNPRPEIYGVCVPSELLDETWMHSMVHDEQLRLVVTHSWSENHVQIKKGYCNVLLERTVQGGLTLYYDTTNPLASRAKFYVEDAIQQAHGRQDVVSIDPSQITVTGLRYIDFLVPGLLALSLMSSSLFGVGMTIVSNRKESLLKRLLLTPMYPADYLISHIVGRVFVFLVEFSAILLFAYLIFGFRVEGSFGVYVFLALGIAMAFSSFALALASRTQSVPYMAGLINLIMVPSVLLGGIFFSRTHYPVFVQYGIDYLPLSLAVDLLRGVASNVMESTEIFLKGILLAAQALFALFVAWRRFRWI